MNTRAGIARLPATTKQRGLLERLQSVVFRARTEMALPRLSMALCAAILLLSLPWMARAEAARGFTPGSLAQIEKARADGPFVLILWSLDCPPCLHELDFLAAYLDKHPQTDMVLVSTDDPSMQVQVDAMLTNRRLSRRVESWIFAEASAQKLRYQVDPNWYGEMPRSYFYDAAHHRVPLSGAVTEKHFDAWKSAGKP